MWAEWRTDPVCGPGSPRRWHLAALAAILALVLLAGAGGGCHVHYRKRMKLDMHLRARMHLDCMLDRTDALDDGARAPGTVALAAEAACAGILDEASEHVSDAVRERMRNEHLDAASRRVAERRARKEL